VVVDRGRVSVVTGASRGIGRLLALHLAALGDAVVAIARPSSDLDSLADGGGGRIMRVPADVTDPAAVANAFACAADEFGPPTTVVTCAGSIDALGPVAEVDPERWWTAVAVDLRGTMLTAQAALRWMLPTGRGRIVTIYGNLGDRGAPNLSAFAAAKAGVARLTETLANEVRADGITVLGMHPGFVRTPMTEHLAWGADATRWIPAFGAHAEKNWGTGTGAVELIDQIIAGAADHLPGRILYAGDDIATFDAQATDDRRRLRIHP
jgi:NAD(P)-dependent dehydrogenase (short-subunit alcohol dehydrogenase family)